MEEFSLYVSPLRLYIVEYAFVYIASVFSHFRH